MHNGESTTIKICLCKDIDVVTHIKIIRLEWAGHVCRMDRSRTQKENLTRKNVW
jgi:hypothetical protein